MRGLFVWAVDNNLVPADPTQGIKNKRSKQAKSGGFLVWTDEEIAAFEKRWPRGTRERVMCDVFLYTGLRRGDAAVVGWQHVRNGVISLQTEKTGIWVHIPILPELKTTLEAGPTGDLAFIANASNGNPMTKESLGNLFAEACRAAGVRKSAHGLRQGRRHQRGEPRRHRGRARGHLRLARWPDGFALHALGQPARARKSCDEKIVEDRNGNIYSLTYARGEGARAKSLTISNLFF
jgi:integrase